MCLISALLASGWVIYSPLEKKGAAKAYEDGMGKQWAGPETFKLDQRTFRWGLPTDAYGGDALAGGISFALHKSFCDRLLPLFPESAEYLQWSQVLQGTFLSCVDLRDTVKRAMDTWAINHRKIYFRDVTDQCMDVESYQRCPAAELFIVPDHAGSKSITKVGDAVAYVTHDLSSIDFAPYTTAGEQISPGLGIRSALMVVRAPEGQRELHDFCFYLDTTFCYGFHRMKDAITTMRTLFIILYVVSIGMLLCLFGGGVRKTYCITVKRDPKDPLVCRSHKCTNLVEYLANMPTLALVLAFLIITFCPIFYFRIFLPCWDCYDFEATMAHEIGHVLGFHHPDKEWELNLNAVGPISNSTCNSALDHVRLNKTRDVADSLMFSMTKHRDRTCLSVDDLEGLNYLYPTCDGAMMPALDTGQPACIKGKRFSGWLRLIYAVLVPWTIVSVVAILTQYVVRVHQKRVLRGHLLELELLRASPGKKALRQQSSRTTNSSASSTRSQSSKDLTYARQDALLSAAPERTAQSSKDLSLAKQSAKEAVKSGRIAVRSTPIPSKAPKKGSTYAALNAADGVGLDSVEAGRAWARARLEEERKLAVDIGSSERV